MEVDATLPEIVVLGLAIGLAFAIVHLVTRAVGSFVSRRYRAMTEPDDVRPDPPELPGGQDDPPDLGLALAVVIHLLGDLRKRLAQAAPDHDHDPDLVLRILAISAVLKRIRDRMEGD